MNNIKRHYLGEYILVNDRKIREYVNDIIGNINHKEYELAAAVIIKGFFEYETKIKCMIGIKLNPKYKAKYKNKTEFTSIEEMQTLFAKHSAENDIVDIGIFPSFKFEGSNVVWEIQFKRFGHYQKERTQLV